MNEVESEEAPSLGPFNKNRQTLRFPGVWQQSWGQTFMQFRLRGISAILAGLSFLAGLSSASEVQAQQPARRITRAISNDQRVTLSGSLNPHVKSASDSGRMDSSAKLTGISLFFKPSATQQQELEQLLAEQQDPSSANYHKWITPAEYAARFGMADSDLQQVQSWLTSQGFTIDSVSPSKNRISFSGTVAQVETAFGTEMHRYSLNGVSHFAPATELSLPATLSGVVTGVRNLNDFRPKPHLVVKTNYTSASSGNHFLAPDDITTIYNVKSLYNRGYDGTGQRIAVVGQSAISLTDIANFRSAAGLAAKAPTPVLVPGTGSSVTSSGDEGESDLDVEWTGGIAKNADIYFVYTGSNTNYGVFDALDYVIETNLAPVVSISYGTCEANLTTSDKTTLLSWFQQANAQGQTLIAAAGDSGSADCDYHATAATNGLAVDVPASFAEVTGIGGTTFQEGSSSYWNSSNNTYNGSALSYIPEKVWNDSVDYSASSLSSGGGGKSTLFSKPSWQSATGVPSDSARDVPDLSFAASASHDGYLYCSSDSSTGITGSCTNGFRDSTSTYLTVAGGTSFGAPVFSGMLTVINQWKSPSGRGNINSSLYSLYTSTPSIFHDVTSGSNAVPCSGSKNCSGGYMTGYTAAAGYDLASGLGSVDVDALAAAMPVISTSSLAATTTTVTASTTTLTSGATVTFTATVAPKSGSGVPTGTITWAVDGTTVSQTSTLTSGTAAYSTAFTQTGSHIVTATYSGNSSYAASYGVVTATLGSTSSTGSSGTGSGSSTVTITSKNSYAGTVKFTLSTSSTSLGGVCYTATSPAVSANSTASATITLYTNTSDCASGSVSHISGPGSTSSLNVVSESKQPTKPTSRSYPMGMGIALASIALIGGVGSRSRKWLTVVCVLVIGSFGLLAGCGGGSSSSSSSSSGSGSSSSSGSASFTVAATDVAITKSSTSNVPAGTYSITVIGTDSSSSSLKASTTFTLTIK